MGMPLESERSGCVSSSPDVSHPDVLGGDVIRLREMGGAELALQSRGRLLTEWFDARYREGLDPYVKYSDGPIGPQTVAYDRKGKRIASAEGYCVNFASQDYLGLSAHPTVKAAAIEAIDRYGVHSAGSPALMGSTRLSRQLEERLAAFTQYADVTLFPTGWAAGYGIVRLLAGRADHIVIDRLAHACLMEGAVLSTRNVHVFPHLNNTAAIRALADIRKEDAKGGILVVTESLFSMDSDTPCLGELQDACRSYSATLLVDCAHDLGAMGPTGRGMLESQLLAGQVDVLMGSFSKTFASNGGFVATNDPTLKLAIIGSCGPALFSNAMSPVQAAAVHAAIDVVDSQEGARRRKRLACNVDLLRDGLRSLGLSLIGEASPIVPFVVGQTAFARLLYRSLAARGAVVNLVEFPAVARDASRIRLQVMSEHEASHIDYFLGVMRDALQEAKHEFADLTPPVHARSTP